MKSAVARIGALLALAALWMTTVSLVSISPAGTVIVAPVTGPSTVGVAPPAQPTVPVVPLPAPPQPVVASAVPLTGGAVANPERKGIELPAGQMVCDCKPATSVLSEAGIPTPLPS